MEEVIDKAALLARAEAHASMLEAAATLMELDDVGTEPESGHVHHLRRMAGAIRAQAAIGKRAMSYTGGRYLPDPALAETKGRAREQGAEPVAKRWH